MSATPEVKTDVVTNITPPLQAVGSGANGSPGSVFLDPNAQRVFWGQLISQACDKLMSVGMIWVLSTRFSPKWIPWFIAIGALPHFLNACQSGKWINRFGALPTVIWADGLRGVLFVVAAGVVSQVHSDNYLLAILLVTALISNVAGSLFNPAILSLPVAMLEPGLKRDKLTALIDSCFSFGNVLGPLVSATTYSMFGLVGMLFINGLSYFFSAVLASGIKLQSPHKKAFAAPGDNVSEPPVERGMLEVLKGEPVVAGMLITFLLMNFFLAPLMLFMPWYARNVYGSDIMGLARLELFLGIGTVAGGLLLSCVQIPGATWIRITAALSFMAVSYLGFTYSPTLLLGCVSVAFLGFFLALANVIILNFFQGSSKPEDVPTVMGAVNLISVASLPVSMGVIGAFIEHVSVPCFATICAAIVVAIALSIRVIPGIQEI